MTRMKPSGFQKKTIPHQFADRLEADLRAGLFVGLLPSVRLLASRYGLNVLSLHRGLRLLVQRGILLDRGPRRRLAVVPLTVPVKAAAHPVPCCRPMVVVGAELGEVSSAVMLALRDVEQACAERGGRCVSVDVSTLSPAARRQRIRTALLEHKPTHVILVYCDQEVYRLVAKPAIKVAVIAGNIVAPKAVSLSADQSLLAMAAFDDLRKLGHRSFRLISLGRTLSPAQLRRLADFAAVSGIDATAVSGKSLDLPTMSRVLATALAEGATSFAFPRPEDIVLATAYFDSVGLKIPRDLSLVLLMGGPYDFLQARQVAHFKFRKDQYLSLILNWVEFGESSTERYTREIIATYRRGRTVGPVKSRR